jgi:hypothetical protein
MVDALGHLIEMPICIAEPPHTVDLLRADPCAYCGGPGGTIDHIVPIGGDGEKSPVANCTGACENCNHRKSHKPLLRFLLEQAWQHDAETNRFGLNRSFFSTDQIAAMQQIAS